MAPEPIRPPDGFGIPTPKSGNNMGTLRVPSPFFPCFWVPPPTRKSLQFQIKVLCHGSVLSASLARTKPEGKIRWRERCKSGPRIAPYALSAEFL